MRAMEQKLWSVMEDEWRQRQSLITLILTMAGVSFVACKSAQRPAGSFL